MHDTIPSETRVGHIMIKFSVQAGGNPERNEDARESLKRERLEKIEEIKKVEVVKANIYQQILATQELFEVSFGEEADSLRFNLEGMQSRFNEITELTKEIHDRLEWISRELGE